MSFLKNLFKYSWYTRSEFKMKDSRIVFEHADTKENCKIHFFFLLLLLYSLQTCFCNVSM